MDYSMGYAVAQTPEEEAELALRHREAQAEADLAWEEEMEEALRASDILLAEHEVYDRQQAEFLTELEDDCE